LPSAIRELLAPRRGHRNGLVHGRLERRIMWIDNRGFWFAMALLVFALGFVVWLVRGARQVSR
jgi:hypothetical protein